MAVDLQALDKAAAGNPDAKVTVSKRWLQEVHRLLIEGDQAEVQLVRSRELHELREGIGAPMGRIFDQLYRPRR